jgi:hypothetical protein
MLLYEIFLDNRLLNIAILQPKEATAGKKFGPGETGLNTDFRSLRPEKLGEYDCGNQGNPDCQKMPAVITFLKSN